MHVFSVEDLSAAEVAQAQEMLQRDGGQEPAEIIRAIRGAGARLLNPDEFSRDLQRRLQSIEMRKRRDEVAGR